MTAASSSAQRTPIDELADETAYGALYLRRLRRAQLELSLLGLVAFGGLVGGLPLLLFLVPALTQVQVLGLPLAALIVAVPISPMFVAIGLIYQRRADALDEMFRDLVRGQ